MPKHIKHTTTKRITKNVHKSSKSIPKKKKTSQIRTPGRRRITSHVVNKNPMKRHSKVIDHDHEARQVPLSCIVLPNRHESRRKRKIEYVNKKKEKSNKDDEDNEKDHVDEPSTSVSTRPEKTMGESLSNSRVQMVPYDTEKYKKLVNIFNGKSGEGFYYKFGVIRKGGKPFMTKFRDISHSFLMELIYKSVSLCATKKKSIVSSEMVCCVAQTFNITPVF